MIEHEKTILFKGFDINQFLRDFSLVRNKQKMLMRGK